MSEAIERYLDRVMAYANRRDREEAARLRAELHDHLTEKVERLEEEGVPREDAVFRAIESHGDPRTVGYSLRPRFPLIDVRQQGTARGVFAFGPRAVGVFAYGGVAVGVVSFGGVSIGVFSMGGVALSLLLAWGGVGVALLGLAYAGVAIGMTAIGGVGLGLFVPSGIGVALLPNEALPAWLQFLDGASKDPWFYNGLSAALGGVFLITWLGGAVLAALERRRWTGKLIRLGWPRD